MGQSLSIAKDRVVHFHYTLRDAEGALRDSSEGSDPMPYLHGHGNIVPGLESALEGQRAGYRVNGLRVPPEQGYGLHDEALDLAIPASAFPAEMRAQLEVGAQFVAEHPNDDDQQVMYTVLGLRGDDVLVSGNHPLAGDVLVFDIEVTDVRHATAEELEHGHVHSPGGHHH